MSYFSEELVRQMTTKNVTGIRLADLTGFSASQISNWTRGEQTTINEQQLSVIQAALGDDAHDHARLVLAHLLDEKFGLNSDLVEVTVRDAGEMRDYVRPSSKGEAALAFLAGERVRNRELNDLLIDLARLLQPVKSEKNAVSSERREEMDREITAIVREGVEEDRKQAKAGAPPQE